MKSSSIPVSSAPTLSTGPSRLASLGKVLVMAMCVSLVSFTAAPQARADGADGSYAVTSVSGSLKFDGDKIDIPEKLVKRIAGVVDGKITIQNDTLRLKRKGALKVAESFAGLLDLDIEGKVTGPSSLVLDPSGETYSGKTTHPIVTTFDIDAFGLTLHGKLKSRVAATVNGDLLRIVIRYSGQALGSDFSGRVTIMAKR